MVPCLAVPNSILDGFSDFKFSTQLVSTVVVAAITVFQVRFEFLAAPRILYGASINVFEFLECTSAASSK